MEILIEFVEQLPRAIFELGRLETARECDDFLGRFLWSRIDGVYMLMIYEEPSV